MLAPVGPPCGRGRIPDQLEQAEEQAIRDGRADDELRAPVAPLERGQAKEAAGRQSDSEITAQHFFNQRFINEKP